MSSSTGVIKRVLLAFAVAVFAGLSGCGSSDSGTTTGTSGTTTTSTTPNTVSMTATAITTTVTGITINSPPVVEFSITDEYGLPFAGLGASDIRFTIAQLNPGSNGEPSAWQSYINTTETAGGVGPGTEDAVQATYENGSSGTLVNHGDGTYTYTFATDITNVTSPVAVTYQPTWTHRLAMQMEGSVPVTNVVYTWQPSTGATTGITTRDIVAVDSCNECHGKLAMHGGGRIDTGYCVTCHNPGTTDANSGNTVDFKVMIHKIHMGDELPSVQAGGSYGIYGYRDTLHDFSDVAFPQNVRNCTKCHDGSNSATPDGDNWMYRPSIEACGACHDNVNFTTGENHGGGGPVVDGQCDSCHIEGGSAGPVADSHVIPEQVAAQQFAYAFTDASYDAVTHKVTAKFKITDPSNGDAAYDLSEAVWSNSTLRLNIAWDTSDYTNTDGNSGISKAVQISFLSSGVLDAAYHSYDAGTGVHTVVSDALPATAQAAGSGSVAIEGYPKVDVDGSTINTPVTSAVSYFAITDTTVQARRQVVDSSKCLQCHETLSLHGNNRVNNTAICVTCHNPNNTDIEVRPAGAVGGIDGKLEESLDFKRMIHAIHAGESAKHGFRDTGVVIYGYRGSVHDYSDFRFPGILNHCDTCHDGNSYVLPLGSNVLPSVIDTTDAATDSDSAAPDTDPTNDLVITPTAAVCSSCHDGPIEQAHMEQNGALFGVTRVQAAAAVEVCQICHGPSRVADVSTVHDVE